MPVDLERQLADYAQWLERRCATTLGPPPPVVPHGDEPTSWAEVGASEPARRRNRTVIGVAASVLVVGLIGTALAVRSDPSPAAFSAPTDPPGPLYLLPSDTDIPVSEGSAAMLLTGPMSPESSLGYSATVGRPVDGGFEGLATVTTTTDVDTSRDWVAGERGVPDLDVRP